MQSRDLDNIKYLQADVLADPFAVQTGGPRPLKVALNLYPHPSVWDIFISNPPYISPSEYWKTTTRSVRGFEPKLALVPLTNAKQSDIEHGDTFYPCLLRHARDIEAKVVLLEVADMDQALRVGRRARSLNIFDGIEIWREQPDAGLEEASVDSEFQVLGEGNARSVICWRGAGASWLGKGSVITS